MFKLATSPAQLEKKEYVDAKYTQVASSRDATGSSFANGQIRFKWSQSSDEWFSPSKSYVRARVTLNDSSAKLNDADNVAAACNMFACMIQSIELRLQGVTISQCSSFVPQIDTLTKRTECSGSHMKSVLKDLNILEHDIHKRATVVADDMLLIEYMQDATTIANNVADVARGLKDFELIWVPTCLSAVRQSRNLPGGEWEMILTPHSSPTYKTQCIQSTGASKTAASDFDVNINDIYYYRHTMRGPRVENLQYYLALDEVRCQSKPVGAVTLKSHTFDVAPTTHQLVFAFQDSRSDTRVSKSMFQSFKDTPSAYGEQEELKRFFFTYAGQKQPAIDLELSGNGTTANREYLSQVYHDSLAITNQLECLSEPENLRDFKEMGMYLAYDVTKDASDRSTRVSVNTEFDASAEVTNMDILCFDYHRSVVQVTIQNGQTKQVLVQDA